LASAQPKPKSIIHYLLPACFLLMLAAQDVHAQFNRQAQDTLRRERPTFRLTDRYGDPFSNRGSRSPFYMQDPSILKLDIQIDTSMNYTIYERIGELDYRPPSTMSFEDYRKYQERQMLKDYWQNRSKELDGESAVSGRSLIPKIYTSPGFDRIFGGSYVEIVPRGFVTLDFGGNWQRINNPAIPIRQQRNGGFEFDQQINMSLIGKVGEKLAVSANFDTNNSFDFQNSFKVEYTGFEEDILKKLEFGNVSLPLNNSLISGSQNLFGVKAQMQFGKLFVTTVASTQRGRIESIEIQGGGAGQGRPFEMPGSNYDENRHFFLGHFFRENYERWLAATPQITSGINITRVEVYLLNRNNDTQTLRNVMATMDLGEPRNIYRNNLVSSSNPAAPNANSSNSLFSQLQGITKNADLINGELEAVGYLNGTDFEKINGSRRLAPTEYFINPQLGYITLFRKLQNDEALAVAYEYTYNGRVFKVGELSEDYANRPESEVIHLKMLRPRKISIRDDAGRRIPTWDLMMKNIYNLNVTNLQREAFQLRVIYRDDRTGIDNPQLQEGVTARTKQLLEIVGLDRLNQNNDPQRDGNFDFVENITINTQNGLIIFPILEPFNTPLRREFANDGPNADFLINKYVYDTLYNTTKADAELIATKNKFFLVGQYSAGAAQEILIPGFNISEGSVKVYSGGVPLREGVDYQVDYTFGKVTILNEGVLNSGKNLSVQYEQADPFAFQTRTLIGSRFDYRVSDDINFGSTVLYFNERPLITRNLIGNEPARNLLYGADFSLRKESRLITKALDALPMVQTKENSLINFNAEFAQLVPGTSNQVDGEGTSYIDDFENSATPFTLINPLAWKLAATPRTSDNRFDPSNGALNDISAGYNRAKLAWYQVDNLFYRQGGRNRPDNINAQDLQNHYVRAVTPQEIFPNRDLFQGNFFEPILDIAYYPAERGPYNYNLQLPQFISNPRQNWAGVTTAIRSEVDFDKANIEYIEFWLLDPFIQGVNGQINDGINPPRNNATGGQLIFHLGSISEDVIRDGKHGFENGLPPDGNIQPGSNVTETPWGYVTNQQFLTNAFDNNPASRQNQDVGWDGMPNTQERIKFQDFINTAPIALRPQIEADPSADDFRYFLNAEYDARDAKILERYKNFNGLESNSPIITGNDLFTPSGSPLPDNEDLNADNTLSEVEEYYSYTVNLRPDQIESSKYVVDKIITNNNISGEAVTWYLFRIPIRQFDDKFGNISGFKSIRYARMVMTDFSEPVVLRMANFRFVGNRWRRYLASLEEPTFGEPLEPNLDNFTLSVVNIEENGAPSETQPPYVVPPGMVRDRDNTSTIQRRLNEQSIQLCVDDLLDGDARAVFKNVTLDLINYGRVKMFLHANSTNAQDNQLHAFLRLGTDFDENYYEVAVPLIITRPSARDDREIWPLENEIDITLNELYALKSARDRIGFNITELYPQAGPQESGKHLIRMRGRPDLSDVRVMMIGIRNPLTQDGGVYNVCVWANELRLTDFNREAGWAANAMLGIKLADIGNVTAAARHSTFGFGGVQSKIQERTREEASSYDVSANINVDKLLPEFLSLRVPMFVSYERRTINPRFDPANPDITLESSLLSFQTEEERNEYRDIVQDQFTRRSLNFSNVKKVKRNQEARKNIYDIENFAFTYAFSEATRSNFTINDYLQRNYKGAVAYNFNPQINGFEPFKEANIFKSPYLKLIKEFNINPVPSNISVRGDLDRSLVRTVFRNDRLVQPSSVPNLEKLFTFNRFYNVRWNFTKNLVLEYNARASAIIDEPNADPFGDLTISPDEYRDSVLTNLKKLGRMRNFDQTMTANYTVPFDKFPLTDWISSEVRYQSSYNWRAGPVELPDSLDFGNILQNSRERTLSGRLDMVKLYNKVKFLKDVNTPPPPPRPGSTAPARPGQPTLQTQAQAKADTVKKNDSKLLKGFARTLMSLRSINGSYTYNEGTILPGFNRTPFLFGLEKETKAPGIPFILGDQDPDIRFRAAENGWLIKSNTLTNPFTQAQNTDYNLRANVEPNSDFKIIVDVRKTVNGNYQELFRDTLGLNNPDFGFASLNPTRNGNYKITFMTIRTAFRSDNNKIESSTFKQFEENLGIMQQRFGDATGRGYEDRSQDVLIAAFLSAYSGSDANNASLSPFPKFPLPNWRVDYTGLNKIPAIKEIFQNVSISHVYNSSYTVNNFTNSLQYAEGVGLATSIEDYNRAIFASIPNEQGELIPLYVISQVTISEQFAPLIGVNVRTRNRLTGRVEYKTRRDIALNISNSQVTEVNNRDVGFELGYTKNNMKLPFKMDGRTIVLENDITFRLNMTVTNNQTIQRKIDELNTITAGNINFQLRPNIDYTVNQKLNIRIYFERTVNEPQISTAFRRATTRFGTQVRFNLAQ
jgi:cell surface protein SprA